eukprot:143114-Ditylum_brightwellii.AAC.1
MSCFPHRDDQEEKVTTTERKPLQVQDEGMESGWKIVRKDLIGTTKSKENRQEQPKKSGEKRKSVNIDEIDEEEE